MDTNVKKFKFSPITKAICILLCFVTLLASTALVTNIIMCLDYSNGEEISDDFTESAAFKYNFANAVNSAMDEVIYSDSTKYDDNEYYSDYGYYADNCNHRLGTSYYAVSGDRFSSNIFSSIDEFNEAEVYQNEIYFAYKNGKVTSKGISQKTIDYIVSIFENANTSYAEYADKIDIYVYYSFPEESNNIFEYIDHGINAIQSYKEFNDTAIKVYDSLNQYIFLALLLMIVSFASGILYLSAAGRRDDSTPAKLAFIDYVPFELHLGISTALGVGASALALSAFNSMDYVISLFIPAIIIYAAVIWLLLFEFCASVARYARSEKKFYKNFLIYHLIKFVIFITKKLIKLDIKILKLMGKSCKRSNARIKKLFSVLTYAPKKFARNVILIAFLYVFINLAVIGIIAMFFAAYMEPLGVVIALGDIGVNIYLFIKFLDYIKKLDMIITAAANHEDIAIDINTLPQSLKTLAESIRYTNAQLQNAVAKAVKDERLKTELITNVSHDLKTPLTSIITYVDLLSKCDIQDEKAQEYIKVLESRGAKLKRLIEDLIEASKVTSGNITVNRSNLNLYELCLQATVDAQSDFEKAGLELIVKENNNAPTIFADGPKSFRVIENLLSNARKYSAKSSRVYVNVYKENGMGIFEIKNVSAQPLDISPDELTERFVRGDKSRNQEGNGLGLSIAKELCRAQNGDLEISIDGDLFKAKAKLPLA